MSVVWREGRQYFLLLLSSSSSFDLRTLLSIRFEHAKSGMAIAELEPSNLVLYFAAEIADPFWNLAHRSADATRTHKVGWHILIAVALMDCIWMQNLRFSSGQHFEGGSCFPFKGRKVQMDLVRMQR